MSIVLPPLSAALQAIGNAQLALGDPLTAAGLVFVGRKDGDATEEITEEWVDLTTETTGNTVHARTLLGVNVSLTVPIVVPTDPTAAAAFYQATSPTGTQGGGYSYPQSPVTTSAVLFPEREVAGGLSNATGATAGWERVAGLGYGAATGAAAAPVHALWIWRATVTRGGRTFRIGDKSVVDVTINGMFDGARPEGHKIYTIGDPAAQGITTIRI